MATSTSLTGLHCNDTVRLRYDPRQIGKVIAIISNRVRVQWRDTTWISDEEPKDLEKENE